MNLSRAAVLFALCIAPTPAFPLDPPAKPIEAVGKADSGIQTRIIAESPSFKAGHPIPLRVELSNTAQKPAPYTHTLLTASQAIAVTDGKPVPFLAGPSGVAARQHFLDPGQTVEIESFDLSKWFYLRRPGKYAVAVRDGMMIPATQKLQFEITPDPAATADGDPVGRLLPLVNGREHWIFVAPPNKSGKLRPGLNRAEVLARGVLFYYIPQNATKLDIRLVWIWLADEEAAEQPPSGEWPPATKPLGKVGRWHVYTHAPDDAVKHWPGVLDDVRKALEAEKP